MVIDLPQKELLMVVIEKDGAILMRKKPEGSVPYKETWYSFGCERVAGQDDRATLKSYLKTELGIDAEIEGKPVSIGSETKEDHDGVLKRFSYINFCCNYLSGSVKVPKRVERVAWIPKIDLSKYDIVPPSVKLFKELGYMR